MSFLNKCLSLVGSLRLVSREIQEVSYGVIPARWNRGEWEVYLIQQRRCGTFGFPKGHPEIHETPLDTMKRELYEETGYILVRSLSEQFFSHQYWVVRNNQVIRKCSFYLLAHVEGREKLDEKELLYGCWQTANKVGAFLKHKELRDMYLGKVFPLLD